MQKKTYGDKQREAQQQKKLEEQRARAAKTISPPDSSKSDTTNATKPEKSTRKTGKQSRRSA